MNDCGETMTSLGIYIHIPFCVRKCSYCDFLSAPGTKEEQQAYIAALRREIDRYRDKGKRLRVKTVFFGGGTPSILPGQAIGEILAVLRECFCFDSDPEISLEANPGTVTEDKLSLWKEAGINRISFGLQSADNQELAMLGRIHTWEQFLESWELADKSGFRNRNIDLMSALPGQTVKSWEHTLRMTARLEPEHLSVYSLIIEEGTPFFQRFGGAESPGFALLPDEEMEREMYALTHRVLGEYGYQRYEISNYARDGFACRHNQGYWNGTPYLGFGAGAASYIIEDTEAKTEAADMRTEAADKGTDVADKEKKGMKCSDQDGDAGTREYIRRRNIGNTKEYIRRVREGLPLEEERMTLTREERMEEFMFLGLRMEKGISFQVFQQRFGCSFFDIYGDVTHRLQKQGLLRETKEGICLTTYGIDVSNYVFREYLLS